MDLTAQDKAVASLVAVVETSGASIQLDLYKRFQHCIQPRRPSSTPPLLRAYSIILFTISAMFVDFLGSFSSALMISREMLRDPRRLQEDRVNNLTHNTLEGNRIIIRALTVQLLLPAFLILGGFCSTLNQAEIVQWKWTEYGVIGEKSMRSQPKESLEVELVADDSGAPQPLLDQTIESFT